jgi:Flp pilus assembly protein TadG
MASIVTHLRRAADDRGAELIELAIVFPILLLLVAGMVDFGFLFQRYEVVTNAAREGARLGSLPGYDQADVVARVQSYLQSSGLSETAVTTLDTVTPLALASGPSIPVARVVVTYPSRFSFIGPVAAMVGGTGWGTITLTSQSVMRLEGGGS